MRGFWILSSHNFRKFVTSFVHNTHYLSSRISQKTHYDGFSTHVAIQKHGDHAMCKNVLYWPVAHTGVSQRAFTSTSRMRCKVTTTGLPMYGRHNIVLFNITRFTVHGGKKNIALLRILMLRQSSTIMYMNMSYT